MLYRFNTFEKLKLEVYLLGIRSQYDYRKESWDRDMNWPLNPGLVYSDEWRGWKDFFTYGY